MNLGSVVTFAVIGVGVTLASTALFSSCGKDSDGSGGGGDNTEVTATDDTVELTATNGDLDVTFPPGSLAVGTVISLAKTETPAEFAALADVPTASDAYECAARVNGTAILEAAQPFTISLGLKSAAALTDSVEKIVDNLCLLVTNAEGKYVWRRSLLEINEGATKVSVSTKIFGTYMAAYCGTAALEGFTERGTVAPKSLICDASTAEGRICNARPMTTKDVVSAYSAFQTECTAKSGSLKENSTCPSAGLVGTCESKTSSGSASSDSYYESVYDESAAKVLCQGTRNTSDAATVTFIKKDGTSEVLTKASTGDDFPFSCHRATDYVCNLYRDPGSGATAAEMKAECQTEQQGVVGTACPTAGFISSCNYTSFKQYYYTGIDGNTASSSSCIASNGAYSETYSAN